MSEIVSTLLLVAIVVSLGALIFTFSSGAMSSLTGSFTGLMSNQANAAAEHFVVEQAAFTTAPATDGFATGGFATASSGTVTLTTSSYNDVIVVYVANEDVTHITTIRTVSSVTATGLSFSARSSGANFQVSAAPYADAEVWYAIAASPLTNVVITVTLSGATDEASIVAVGVSGANTVSPWDTNVALPGHATSAVGATAPSVGGVSTTTALDLVLGFSGIFDATTHVPPTETAGTGFSLVTTQNEAAGTGKSEAAAEAEVVSAAQSGVTVAFGTAALATNAWIMTGDAIQGQQGADVFVRNVGTTSSTLVSVYVVDQTTGAFVSQFTINTALTVGNFVDIPRTTLAFTVTHGQTYSFTVTSSLGNSVIYDAKAN